MGTFFFVFGLRLPRRHQLPAPPTARDCGVSHPPRSHCNPEEPRPFLNAKVDGARAAGGLDRCESGNAVVQKQSHGLRVCAVGLFFFVLLDFLLLL